MINQPSNPRNPDNSFTKGIREVAERDRREAAEVREEIRAELGNIGRSAYYYRQWGRLRLLRQPPLPRPNQEK